MYASLLEDSGSTVFSGCCRGLQGEGDISVDLGGCAGVRLVVNWGG